MAGPTRSKHGKGAAPSDDQIFHYIYAILHSDGYRARYADFLRRDYPRIPLPRDARCSMHLRASAVNSWSFTCCESTSGHKTGRWHNIAGGQRPTVGAYCYSGGTVWLDRKQESCFSDVPEDAWESHVRCIPGVRPVAQRIELDDSSPGVRFNTFKRWCLLFMSRVG